MAQRKRESSFMYFSDDAVKRNGSAFPRENSVHDKLHLENH